ncbi:MAG: peptide chain release factor N(5)-glutamine methyltransferase [Aerococcus sp.]|nr:peptide chain release factor N(5)-glutamine methyltransferase [Aerococcus sp.]
MMQSNPTFKEAVRTASFFLDKKHKDPAIAQWLMDDLMHWSLTARINHLNDSVPNNVLKTYSRGIQRIALDDYPYQYVSRQAWFHGLSLMVSEDVLIPRQETEGIVETVLQRIATGQHANDARVLDIGTGSGAIAIALKHECPTLKITATDISEQALAIAQQNARYYDVSIRFLLGDLITPVANETFDIIVTNPPYIAESEVDIMGADVRKYEPHLALFADDEGYAFYERLIPTLDTLLKHHGFFMAECGYQQSERLLRLLTANYPNNHSQVIKDYTGIDRFVAMEVAK